MRIKDFQQNIDDVQDIRNGTTIYEVYYIHEIQTVLQVYYYIFPLHLLTAN